MLTHHAPASIGHNSRPFHVVTHRLFGVMHGITPPGETPPLLATSQYVDMTEGCAPENLLNNFIDSMRRYIDGDVHHPSVEKYGWGKHPRHARR